MLTCEDVNGFIVDYLEGALPDDLTRRFEKHIAGCGQCSKYVRQYRATMEYVGDQSPEPPQELVEEALAFLRDRMGGNPSTEDSSR